MNARYTSIELIWKEFTEGKVRRKDRPSFWWVQRVCERLDRKNSGNDTSEVGHYLKSTLMRNRHTLPLESVLFRLFSATSTAFNTVSDTEKLFEKHLLNALISVLL